jgi:hypothetical protein
MRTRLVSIGIIGMVLLFYGLACDGDSSEPAGTDDTTAAETVAGADTAAPDDAAVPGTDTTEPPGGDDTAPSGDCWFTTETCASHPPVGPSTMSVTGHFNDIPIDLAECDWDLKIKDNVLEHAVNACPEGWPPDQGTISIWCTTPENIQVLMRVVVKKDTVAGADVVFKGDITYYPSDGPFMTVGKLVEKSAKVTTFDLCGQRAAGTFHGKWNAQEPMGPLPELYAAEVEGTFDFTWALK